ncbi:MAG: V-type ATP synthase subunit E family protein [Candidatus Woesearchaeota archaeon]
MGLDELKAEIINNAKKQAEKINKEAEKEKEIIMNSAEQRIKEIKSKIDEETKNSLEQYKTYILTEINSTIKRKKLMMEKQIIDTVFEKVYEELKNLDKKNREEHIKKILSKYNNYKKVYCSESDYNIVKKYLKSYEPKVIDIIGGLILEDDNGETRINLSYEEILNDIKKKYLLEISKKLF